MVGSEIDVSVIIPARECAGHIRACLEAIAAQDFDGELEVIVALAPSKDSTAAELQKVVAALAGQLAVQVVDNPSGATPSGLNLAIEHSLGRFVARVDAQSRVPSDYVSTALRSFGGSGVDGESRSVDGEAGNTELGSAVLGNGAFGNVVLGNAVLGNVGGVQRPISDRTMGKAASIAAAMSSTFGTGPAAFRRGSEAGAVDTVYLGVFAREALDVVGGYNEMQLRNQDYELNWRLRKAGYLIWFDPDLVVDYYPRTSFRGLASQYFGYGAWKRKMLVRNPGSLRMRQLPAPMLVLGLFVSAVLGMMGQVAGLAIPGVYLLACAVASVGIRGKVKRLRDRVRVFWAFVVMHLSWGFGFFFGSGK